VCVGKATVSGAAVRLGGLRSTVYSVEVRGDVRETTPSEAPTLKEIV
jgi:hypothetical protein